LVNAGIDEVLFLKQESIVPAGARNLKVIQKLVAARPVFEVYDEQTGEKVAVIRQTWLSILRSTLVFENERGEKILTAKGGFLSRTFWLIGPDGKKVAKLTRPLIALRKSFRIFYQDHVLKARGGYLAWGFEAATETGEFAFRFDKKVLHVRDQYRISVGSFMDWTHAVTSATVIDTVFFRGKGGGAVLICCCCVLLILAVLLLLFGSVILALLHP
jgi:uncharacterized protein YxjI